MRVSAPRGVGADLVVAGGSVLVAVANALLDWPIGDAERRVAVGLAVVAGAAMGAVRRWPLAVVAAEALLLVVSGRWSPYTTAVPLLLMLIALGALAYRWRWGVTVLGGVIAFAAMLVQGAGLNQGRFAAPDAVGTVSSLTLAVIPVLAGRYLAGVRRARLVAEERAAEAEARRAVEVRAARLTERSRLARDLHDIVAHHVGAMTLRASSARLAATSRGDLAVAGAALDDVATTGRRVLAELRALLTVLRDADAVDGEPIVVEPEAAVEDAVARVRAAGVRVVEQVDPRLPQASMLVRATVARLVQEALTNVLKHAGPGVEAEVRVVVEESGDVRLLVANSAAARPPAGAALPGSGQGLSGMRERVGLLGGRFAAGPDDRFAWAVRATLPAKEDA